MDSKRRTILVIAIALTMIVGVLSAFGLPFFFQNVELTLPNSQTGGDGDVSSSDNANYSTVSVTKETVQSVIATLERKQQYYRELKIERLWGAAESKESGSHTALIWNDGAYNKTAIRQPDGTLRNCLMADGKSYVWYGSEKSFWETDAVSPDVDLEQNIPTYEDVLSLDANSILRAAYQTYASGTCIFVEARREEFGYLERYWVSVETGLLISAETVREVDGTVLYKMSESLITNLKDDDAIFMLPNGKVLHRVVIVPQAQE